MAVEPDVRDFGVKYVWAGAPSFPMLMVLYTCTGAMRGLGNTWLPMAISISLDVTKSVITFLLISGVVGVHLGVVASGIGTSVAGSLGGLVALVFLVRGIEGVQVRLEHVLAVGRREFARLLNIGLPTMLEEFQFMIAFLVYSRVISGLGTTALAAHTIALRALDGALVPGFALGTAGTTLVSRYLGAGRADLAERAARLARTYAVGTMVVMAALLALLAPRLVSIFVDDPDVVDTGTKLLRILAIAFPFMGLHASLSGALRGAGDVRYVLGTLTVTAWLVRIPFALLFALGFGWGAPGAWLGATLENSVRGLLIWRRFEQGTWKEKVV
jgi:putative MATE family efflux protein